MLAPLGGLRIAWFAEKYQFESLEKVTLEVD